MAKGPTLLEFNSSKIKKVYLKDFGLTMESFIQMKTDTLLDLTADD